MREFRSFDSHHRNRVHFLFTICECTSIWHVKCAMLIAYTRSAYFVSMGRKKCSNPEAHNVYVHIEYALHRRSHSAIYFFFQRHWLSARTVIQKSEEKKTFLIQFFAHCGWHNLTKQNSSTNVYRQLSTQIYTHRETEMYWRIRLTFHPPRTKKLFEGFLRFLLIFFLVFRLPNIRIPWGNISLLFFKCIFTSGPLYPLSTPFHGPSCLFPVLVSHSIKDKCFLFISFWNRFCVRGLVGVYFGW